MVRQTLDPGAQVAHQIPSAPAVGALDGLLQLFVGQLQEGLIGPPGFAFFVEEGQTVGIHVADGSARCAGAPDLLAVVGTPGRAIARGADPALRCGLAADHQSTKRPGASDTGRGHRNRHFETTGASYRRSPAPTTTRATTDSRPAWPFRSAAANPVSGAGKPCPADAAEALRSVPGSAGRRAPPAAVPRRGRWCARSSRRRSAPARPRRPGSSPRTCRT